MPHINIRLKSMQLTGPSLSATTTTTTPIALKKGERVVFGSVQKRVLSDQAITVSIAATFAGGAAAGFLGATDTSAGAAGDLVDMKGADMTGAGAGFLATADGAIKATWNVPTTATILPVVHVVLGVAQHEHTS